MLVHVVDDNNKAAEADEFYRAPALFATKLYPQVFATFTNLNPVQCSLNATIALHTPVAQEMQEWSQLPGDWEKWAMTDPQ